MLAGLSVGALVLVSGHVAVRVRVHSTLLDSGFGVIIIIIIIIKVGVHSTLLDSGDGVRTDGSLS